MSVEDKMPYPSAHLPYPAIMLLDLTSSRTRADPKWRHESNRDNVSPRRSVGTLQLPYANDRGQAVPITCFHDWVESFRIMYASV